MAWLSLANRLPLRTTPPRQLSPSWQTWKAGPLQVRVATLWMELPLADTSYAGAEEGHPVECGSTADVERATKDADSLAVGEVATYVREAGYFRSGWLHFGWSCL